MARKDAPSAAHSRGFSDIIGVALMALALLLLVAQLTFHPHDVASNRVPPNETIHNWIGAIGAWMANTFFFLFGAGAFVLPVLLVIFGLGYLVEFFAYLKRRWAWAVVAFICCIGFLDLYTDRVMLDKLGVNPKLSDSAFLERMARNINASSAGGWIGHALNEICFGYFGKVGATIIFCALYLISLVYLTDFHLGVWLRGVLSREPKQKEDKNWTPEEKVLARRAKDLEKQARILEEKAAKSGPAPAEKSGLGADLKPVPVPMVRDLSVPPLRAASKTPKPKVPEPELVKDGLEGEVIPAKEIVAATTEDILGKRETEAEKNGLPGEKPQPAADPAAIADAVTITDNTVAKGRRSLRKKPIAVASTPSIGNYQLPPFDFLQFSDQTLKPTETKEELMANARLMQNTLAQFDIEVSLGDITKGPTITRYELHPAPGVKMEKITALTNNIAAALKAERIHILAPVPGKSSVGVEVPNLIKTKVIIRELLESEEWQKSKARIPLALGKDVYGHPIIADLAEMPHLLIAGSTGSGKSVCINAIIASLLYRFPPDQLRFVMIDPKVVELQQYNALPHLVVPVVNDPKKVILALRWVVNEMEKRYQIFAKVGVRNIKSFNDRPKNKPLPQPELELPLMGRKEKVEAGTDGFAVEVDEEIVVPRDDDIVIPDKLSYIVVIIDELADLMLVAPADVEMAIARITQMARAAGIHCIVATQRPSVDVITGVIKANIPARIAFQVAARVDSRTILDAMGADKLLGKGDMLYLPPGSARLIRAQGALITDQEIQDIVDFIAKQGKPSYELEIHQQLSKPTATLADESGIDEDEELIQQCVEVIRSEHKASVSLLQRRLRLGYTRAARIMDELEGRGLVGPSKGAEPRDILIDLDGTGADGEGRAG